MSMQVYVNGEITINDTKGLVEAIQKKYSGYKINILENSIKEIVYKKTGIELKFKENNTEINYSGYSAEDVDEFMNLISPFVSGYADCHDECYSRWTYLIENGKAEKYKGATVYIGHRLSEETTAALFRDETIKKEYEKRFKGEK